MRAYHLRIVAHDKVFYDGPAVSVTVSMEDGEYQILYDHENYVFAVVPGPIRYKTEDGTEVRAVSGYGFVEVSADDEVEVLVDTIERPEDIDKMRAQEAIVREEERMRQHNSQLEYVRSKTALAKAMARMKEANRYSRL